ncbi:T9SS type A sorting domain-containing protein [Marinilabilia rubra]|uniref:Secretion system C-terminal sorting domain-containing protein n=1 Tax=Marinilabilia rubra TaxID=2162893 RepID=A0A2U2B4P2_9BACT|nr:T9SS type A sorting domain-containing protein [Marinilabilia rubra]PWD98023.1 hypothetical protein DDZ16_17625 [Marinilabilia rubra]
MKSIRLFFVVGLEWVLILSLHATSFHVTPGGSSVSNGSIDDPWNLQTAFSHPFTVQAGDTILIHEGIYSGFFVSQLSGTDGNPIIVSPYQGERVIIEPPSEESGTAALSFEGQYCHIFGLIFRSQKETRSEAGSSPDDYYRADGVAIFGDYNKLINCVIYDNIGNGIGFWSSAPNSEIYGCIIFNNGWIGTDRGHGHAVYTQNESGTKRIANNIVFNSAGFGFHVYTENGGIEGYNIFNNIFFNCGLLANTLETALLVGGFQPASRITISNNCLYQSPEMYDEYSMQLGYGTLINVDATVLNNYIVGGDEALGVTQAWEDLTIRGNTFVNPSTLVMLENDEGYFSVYDWDNNAYFGGTFNGVSFSEWQDAYGFDQNSSYSENLPSSNKVFVYPNEYEEARANIAVYNWEFLDQVEVDVSSFLSDGEKYYLFDAENMNGIPVVEGEVSGNSILVPMNLTETFEPYGNLSAIPPHTGIDFGAFVVIGESGANNVYNAPAMRISRCYPNPTVDIFVIEFANVHFGKMEVNVFDNNGHLVHNEVIHPTPRNNRAVLNLAPFPAGMYIVSMTGEDGTNISCKVVKNDFTSSQDNHFNPGFSKVQEYSDSASTQVPVYHQ